MPQEFPFELDVAQLIVPATHIEDNGEEGTEEIHVGRLVRTEGLTVVFLSLLRSREVLGGLQELRSNPKICTSLSTCPVADTFDTSRMSRDLQVPEASTAFPEMDDVLQDDVMGRFDNIREKDM